MCSQFEMGGTLPRRISIHSGSGEKPVLYACREMGRYLEKAGHEVVWEGEAFPIRFTRTEDESLRDGAYRWCVSETGISLEFAHGAGAVYGCYHLLEMAGFRFLTPDCEVCPGYPLRFPSGEGEEHPAFRVREVFWRSAIDGVFAVKMRLNGSRSNITEEQGGKAMFFNFSHTFNQLVPVEKYFDTHPEYFSMIRGKRCRDRTQLCLTNPDVLKLCIEGVLEWKRAHPAYQVFSVAMNDWYQNCRCPACQAVDMEEESGAGTMIRFVNAVAEETAKVFPDIRIHTFAYLYCRKPPRHTKPRENVIVRLCAIESCYSHPMEACGCETGPIDVQYTAAQPFSEPEQNNGFLDHMKEWSRICPHLYIWDYTTNYANYLQPFPNLDVLGANLRTFRKAGVEGVLEQGNFSRGRASAFGDLKVYLLGHLLWDPDADQEKLTREFAQGVWGPGAPFMLRCAAIMQEAASHGHMGIYDAPDAFYLQDTVLTEAERNVSEALRVTEGTRFHESVEREALSFRYVRLVQEKPDTPGHGERVETFGRDAERLGIAELFERRDFQGSLEVMKTSYLTRDRHLACPIQYPL